MTLLERLLMNITQREQPQRLDVGGAVGGKARASRAKFLAGYTSPGPPWGPLGKCICLTELFPGTPYKRLQSEGSEQSWAVRGRPR